MDRTGDSNGSNTAYEISGINVDSYLRAIEHEYAANTANRIAEEASRESSPYGLTVNDYQVLIEEDWHEILQLVSEYEKNGKLNPDDTGNTIMAGFIKTVANARRNKNNESKDYGTRLNIGGFEVNSLEMSLAIAHPIEGTAYANVGILARDKALEIYTQNSCWSDGNGDAFRHISWSALLYCRFYDMHDSSHETARERALVWTNAHEGYDANSAPSAFDESLPLVTRMDLYNNLIGFLLAETRINLDSYSDATIFIRAESWTDDGKGNWI